MTRLNSNSHQNVARFNSANQVVPQVARSVTCITANGNTSSNGSKMPQNSILSSGRVITSSSMPGASSPTKSMSSGEQPISCQSVTAIMFTLDFISSDALGSVSGMLSSAFDGREVLTVNVNQINADLQRQASTVLSQHHDITELPPLAPQPTSSFTHIASIPITTHGGHHHLHHHHHLHSHHVHSNHNNHHHHQQSGSSVAVPFSLPSSVSRR